MSVRLEEYTALIKSLMGPRNGSDEVMEKDPRNEYVTGILEPKDYDRTMDDFGSSDIGTYIPEKEGEEDSSDHANDFEIHPEKFDPRALPKSLGLSFVVTSKEKPQIDACITWARYLKNGNKWHRTPEKHIQNYVDATKDDVWRPSSGVRVVINSILLEENVRHVSLYLVNETKIGNALQTPDLIFQPQIRVHFHGGVSAISVDRREISEDEGYLELLFKDLPGLARGHLCGATWKDIDPERPSDGFKENPLIPADILKLEEKDREKFVCPHVRTEYLPTYSVNQSTVLIKHIPTMRDQDTSANTLAEKWNGDDLALSLEKIAVQYGKWIERQREKVEGVHDSQKPVATRNLDRCSESARRIMEGIRLLQEKEDVRLAFCFMNKAMDTQSCWSRQRNLVWRPFQIGFILQCISGIENRHHEDRELCDLLWYPTGGGKTEAYLGLMIFTLALRRLRGKQDGLSPYGTTIISRYTLRLLTIQQFRRALAAVTAAEYLRTTGWMPISIKLDQGWGTSPFSIGLWVGSGVTPNHVVDHNGWDPSRKMGTRYAGANSILKYTNTRSARPGERVISSGEPAQVLQCPCCSATMSVPSAGYVGREHELFWTVKSSDTPAVKMEELDYRDFKVTEINVTELKSSGYYCIGIKFTSTNHRIDDRSVNDWWRYKVQEKTDCRLMCSAPSRPGYFIITAPTVHHQPIDFELHCPNPSCALNNVEWSEQIPSNGDSVSCRKPLEPFSIPAKEDVSYSIPIPAYTVDTQVYTRVPSIVIATVDKFARLPFEPRAAAIFGNVNTFDSVWGHYRPAGLPDKGEALKIKGDIVQHEGFIPPELIIQDELHLIEGPLGSMVGIYETAIDFLARKTINNKPMIPKYVASTATTRQAATQIQSLYNRKLRLFPQSGITALDNFFSNAKEGHPLDDMEPGRLYVGVCAPGKGPQTPTVRIWSSILQQAERIRRRGSGEITRDLDYFWTVVGYFNAIRELAAARSLYRQDIPEWIKQMDGEDSSRVIEDYRLVELNSNIDSAKIPAVLEQLEASDSGVDAVMATSMFGTGVDINRLSLMVVHGQPKTTSSYIQATGRVGRERGALVVTFLRSTRPRDLDHYEFFTGYHRALHRYVEPVTVAPFSPRACDRALGPVAVSILRNGTFMNTVRINPEWATETEPWKGAQGTSGSRIMKDNRSASDLGEILNSIERRSQDQPLNRKRARGQVGKKLGSDFDLWENIASSEPDLCYFESAFNYQPNNSVVLGDEQHDQHKKKMVFKKTPQSLRDVESTTRFSG